MMKDCMEDGENKGGCAVSGTAQEHNDLLEAAGGKGHV